MSQIGEKLRRLLTTRGWTQAQLKEESGVSQGIISQLINDKQNSVSPENLKRLSQAFAVPVTYFLTDSPKEYMAAKLATRDSEETARWKQFPVHRRIQAVLDDLERNWGSEYGLSGLAIVSGISVDSLGLMLAGGIPITAHVIASVAELTGVPVQELTGNPSDLPESDLPPKYLELAETAYTLGLDPEYLHDLLVLLARRPTPVPPDGDKLGTKSREPGN